MSLVLVNLRTELAAAGKYVWLSLKNELQSVELGESDVYIRIITQTSANDFHSKKRMSSSRVYLRVELECCLWSAGVLTSSPSIDKLAFLQFCVHKLAVKVWPEINRPLGPLCRKFLKYFSNWRGRGSIPLAVPTPELHMSVSSEGPLSNGFRSVAWLFNKNTERASFSM